MRATRLLTTIGATVLTIFLFGACAERLAEFGLEQAIEASAEGDVDVDFDFDDGGISVSGSEDGEDFSFSLDAEDGTFVFEGPDGEEGVVQFSEDGIDYETSEGSGTIGIDEDNGQIDFDTDDGSGTVSFGDGGLNVVDENGNETFSIEEDNGVTRFESAEGVVLSSQQPLPGWPSVIGVPATLDTNGSNFSSVTSPEGRLSWNGILTFDQGEDFVGGLAQRLTQAGFTQSASSDFGGGGTQAWENGNQIVSLQWSPGTIIIALTQT